MANKKLSTTELIQAICQMQGTIDELYGIANQLNKENKELKDELDRVVKKLNDGLNTVDEDELIID